MVDSYSTALLVASVLMIGLSSMALATRLWVRMGILGGLGWDDALITTSWVFAMALYSAALAARNFGFGTHLDDVPKEHLSTFARLVIVCSTTFSWAVPAAKASFAVLYLRILQGRRLALLNKFLIAFVLCQAFEETLVVVLQCRPIARAWDSSIPGHCYQLVPMWWCTFVFNLSTDLTLFIQPIPSMWRLQLPLAKRVGIIAMLSLGLLVCIISVIRIIFATKIGPDTTFALAEPMIWSEVEVTALILCSCIPSLRQVIQKMPWLNHLVGLSSDKGSSANAYYDHHSSGVRNRSRSRRRGGGTGGGGGGGGGPGARNHIASIALHSRSQHGDPFGVSSRAHYGGGGAGGGGAGAGGGGGGPGGAAGRAERGGAGLGDGMTDSTRPPSQDGSTDEIFPFRHHHGNATTTAAAVAGGGLGGPGGGGLGGGLGGVGGIVVTHDIKHDVEISHEAVARSKGTDSDSSSSDSDVHSPTRPGGPRLG